MLPRTPTNGSLCHGNAHKTIACQAIAGDHDIAGIDVDIEQQDDDPTARCVPTTALVINLKRRPDRWQNTVRRLSMCLPKSVGVERVVATDARDHAYLTAPQAICRSFTRAIERVQAARTAGTLRNTDWVLVFEDDILPHRRFGDLFTQLCRRLPALSARKQPPPLVYIGANQYGLKGDPTATLQRMRDAKNLTLRASNRHTLGAFGILYRVDAMCDVVAPRVREVGMRTPYDNLLAQLPWARYGYGTPLICWPNLVIADVRDSDARCSRDLVQFARTRHWHLDDYIHTTTL